MSEFKKLLSLLLCLVMLFACIPMANAAQADRALPSCEEPQPQIGSLVVRESTHKQPVRGVTYHTSEDTAIAEMRAELVKRNTRIVIGYKVRSADLTQAFIDYIYPQLFYSAVAHTGVGNQGDYLYKDWNGYSPELDYDWSGGYYYCLFTYNMKYKTSAAREAELTAAIDAFIASNIASGMTDYEKFRVIYDWICQNVTYDYDNLNNDSYDLKYTAYAAMINKTAVCQGYATLLYRMLLQCGVDNRVISGFGNGGRHGWNIVKLDGSYYNVDATWDANYTPQNYMYCLKNDANFLDHIRDAEFADENFYRQYPMSDRDYGSELLFDIPVARMLLGNSLEFQFAVPKSACKDWTGAYARIIRQGEGINYSYTVPVSRWTTVNVSGEPHWAVSYDLLTAVQMADTFQVTIYDGQGNRISNVHRDSVRDYVERGFSGQTQKGKTMLADMLCYGAAAQRKFGYKVDDPADKNLTAAQRAYATATTPSTANIQVKGQNFGGTRLLLESRIQMQVAFKNITTDMYAIYSYTNHQGVAKSYIVRGYDFQDVGNGFYGVELNAIVYADARGPVTVKVYSPDGKVVGQVTDSIESYVSRSGNTEFLVALMRFADSAKAYLLK